MDPHIKICEELFSACKTEFKKPRIFFIFFIILSTRQYGKIIEEGITRE